MDIARRTVLQAGGIIAVGGVVAACSSSSTDNASSAPATNAADGSGASAPASGDASAAGVVAQVADIPVGGGVILADRAVVLTQPTAGDVKAFSAVCTHQGCLVGEVTDNEIICPCHGSRFSATDGAVTSGPAQTPLAAQAITVEGGAVVLNG